MSHFCTDKRGFGWYFGHLSVGSWLSREPLDVESWAGRHSKALHKTHSKHLSELKLEVICEVKVRSRVNIRRFFVLGPGDQEHTFSVLKLRRNVLICMVKACYNYRSHTDQMKRSRSDHKRSLYVKVVI